MAYMGATQFKAFQKCEAAALATLRGEWAEKKTVALLVGGYVDAYFSGELEQYKEENPDIFSSRYPYDLKKDYKVADKIIERMKRDRLYMLLMAGRKQVIRTGFIAGVPFKIKIDVLLNAEQSRQVVEQFPETAPIMGMCDGAIVDQKLMANFEAVWSPEDHEKIPFVEYWGYDTQGAIYQTIDGRIAPFVIVGATKEAETNIDAFYIPDDDLSFALSEVEALSPRYAAIKRGEIEPEGCGKCAYCRSTKRLSSIKHYKSIINQEDMTLC
jgi:hypothetical protein